MDEVQVLTTSADINFLNSQTNDLYDILDFVDRVYTFTGTPAFNYERRVTDGFKTLTFTKDDGKIREFQIIGYTDRRASVIHLTERESSLNDKPFFIYFLNDKGLEKTNVLTDLKDMKIIELNSSTKRGDDMTNIRKSVRFGLDTDGIIVTDFFQSGISLGFENKRRVVCMFLDGKHPDQMHQIAERTRVNLNNHQTKIYFLKKSKEMETVIEKPRYDHTITLFKKNNEIRDRKNANYDFSKDGENNYLYINSISGKMETNAALLSYDRFESETKYILKNNVRTENKMKGWGYKVIETETLSFKIDSETKAVSKFINENNREENKTVYDNTMKELKSFEKLYPSMYVGIKKEIASIALRFAKLKKEDGFEIGKNNALDFINDNFINGEFNIANDKVECFIAESQRFIILSDKKTKDVSKRNLYKKVCGFELGVVYTNKEISDVFKKFDTERLKDQTAILDTFFDYEKGRYTVDGEQIRGYVFKTKKTFDFINALD